MRAIDTTFLISNFIATIPFEAFRVFIEQVIVNGTMAILVPVIPGAAIPVHFELACVSLAPLSPTTYCRSM